MNAGVAAYKEAVPFPEIVGETHEVDRTGKVLCPFHNDHKPSCHVYRDGFKCFSCGAHGDHIDWLEQVRGLPTAEAIRELERRAGGSAPPSTRRQVRVKPEATFKPVSSQTLERHRYAAARLSEVPVAMWGRGFTAADLRQLEFASENGDAIFPVTGPDGGVLALKRRVGHPGPGNSPRYVYTTLGHGCPAWCSSGFMKRRDVLVVEGELNGMACFVARPGLGVMGAAGTNGPLHFDALKDRTVYVYADGDLVGQQARDRWAAQALEVGAAKVFVLDPWDDGDACDVAGKLGWAALAERLS